MRFRRPAIVYQASGGGQSAPRSRSSKEGQMSGFERTQSTTPRWRTALRAGALAAALAVVVGAPLAAQARDFDHGRAEHGREWRGHEWREHEWREHHPYWGGYYGPRYYAPAYGYYAPGYYAPGLSLTIR